MWKPDMLQYNPGLFCIPCSTCYIINHNMVITSGRKLACSHLLYQPSPEIIIFAVQLAVDNVCSK